MSTPTFLDPTQDAGTIGLLDELLPYCILYTDFRFGMGINGVNWKEIDGLDISGMRTGDSGRPRDQGEFAGYDFLGGRDITFKGDVSPGGPPNVWTTVQNLNTLSSAFLPQSNVESAMYFYLPNLMASYMNNIVHGATGPSSLRDPPIITSMVRPRNRSWKIDPTFSNGQLAQDIQLLVHATDPRLYGYPTNLKTFVSDIVYCPNNGNFDCRPIVVLQCPATSAGVFTPSLNINGNTLTWGGSGYDLPPFTWLTIDLYNKTTVITSPTNWVPQNSAQDGYNVNDFIDGVLECDNTGPYTAGFDGFDAASPESPGQVTVQTGNGSLAVLSYTGFGVGDATLTGVNIVSGAIDASTPGGNLVSEGSIMQGPFTTSPFSAGLQPGSEWGVFIPTASGETTYGNTIWSENCYGYVYYADSWIL